MLHLFIKFCVYFVETCYNLFSIHNYEAHSSDKKRATFAPCRSVMSRCEFVAEYTSGILTPDSATWLQIIESQKHVSRWAQQNRRHKANLFTSILESILLTSAKLNIYTIWYFNSNVWRWPRTKDKTNIFLYFIKDIEFVIFQEVIRLKHSVFTLSLSQNFQQCDQLNNFLFEFLK